MPVEEEEREVKISDYYYKKSDIDTQMNNKVDKDGNKVLSDNNYTNADKAKLTNMTPADYVTSQSLSSTLSSYVVTSTLNNYYTQSEIDNIVNTINNNKISKSQTAGLVKNDGTIDTTTYSTASHTHGNLQTNGAIGTSNNANKNVITDANGKITTENKPVIPTNVSDLTNDAGYLTSHQDLTNYIQKSQTTGLIKNDGTIDTTTYLTTHQDISEKEDSNNKVTSWTPTTTDTHYPSEKLVKDSLDGKINTSDIVDNVTTNDATKVLSAKQGKALSDGISNLGNSFGQTITGVYNNIPTKTSDLTNDGSDGANIFVSSNDSRLTNARAPTSHGHGNISNTGSIGGAGGKPLITEAYGKITTGSFGTTSGTFAEGNHTHNQYLTSHQSLSDIGGAVTIEKQSTAETGYTATYIIKQGGIALSPKINIPKDYLVKSASLEVVGATPTTLETNNNLVTGDKYLKFVVNTQENDDITNLIIPVNDLGQEYDADNTTIVLNNGVFSVKSNVFADKTHTHSQYLTEHQSLSDYVQKSQTNGLLKNDGTVDTNTYLTSHQTLPTIVDNLTTNDATQVLSANQGKVLNDNKEDTSNKSSSITTDTGSTTKYPTVKAVEDYAEPKKEVGTFTELKSLIDNANDGDMIVLDKDYINSDNIQSITTTPNKSIHIDGNGHVLNFKGNNRTSIIMVANKSSIENCIITESRASSIVLTGNNCSISNCVFKLAVAGALLTITGANSYITDCIFHDNNGGGSTVLINITSSSGNESKNFYIKNCLFFNNNVYSVIYINHNSESVSFVDSCEFLNNTTIGGGIAQSNGQFGMLNNNVYSNCIFSNNIATGSNTGGAMTVNKSDTYSPILINNKFITSNDTITPDTIVNQNYLTEHQDISGKEDNSNKSSSITTDTGSTTKYPTVKAVEDYAQPIGNYLTSHQDISGKEDINNKVTSLSSSSTDTQYPSAKLVYDNLNNKIDASNVDTMTATINYTDNTSETVTFYIAPTQNN